MASFGNPKLASKVYVTDRRKLTPSIRNLNFNHKLFRGTQQIIEQPLGAILLLKEGLIVNIWVLIRTPKNQFNKYITICYAMIYSSST
jgi:hypothetical protein